MSPRRMMNKINMGMQTFTAKRTMRLSVQQIPSAPMATYLATPDRVVGLCFPQGRGRRVDDNSQPHDAKYEVRMLPQAFLFLNFEPVVGVRATSTVNEDLTHANLTMGSEQFRIDGLPPELRSLNDDVNFVFEGGLTATVPTAAAGTSAPCSLDGTARLSIRADVPPMLQMVPGMAQAAEQALEAVLERLQQQLIREVAGDYRRFAAAQQRQQQQAAAKKLESATHEKG